MRSQLNCRNIGDLFKAIDSCWNRPPNPKPPKENVKILKCNNVINEAISTWETVCWLIVIFYFVKLFLALYPKSELTEKIGWVDSFDRISRLDGLIESTQLFWGYFIEENRMKVALWFFMLMINTSSDTLSSRLGDGGEGYPDVIGLTPYPELCRTFGACRSGLFDDVLS